MFWYKNGQKQKKFIKMVSLNDINDNNDSYNNIEDTKQNDNQLINDEEIGKKGKDKVQR